MHKHYLIVLEVDKNLEVVMPAQRVDLLVEAALQTVRPDPLMKRRFYEL
jgi:hypothetical protein